MPDARVVEWIREKFVDLAESLDERGRRRWAAIEARSLGRGGIAAVAKASGMSERTIRTGIQELAAGDALPPGRQRRQGAGRRSRKDEQPALVGALEQMIAPPTRGEPPIPCGGPARARGRSPRNCKAKDMKSVQPPCAVCLPTWAIVFRPTVRGKKASSIQIATLSLRTSMRASRRENAGANQLCRWTRKRRNGWENKSNGGQEYEPKGQPRKTDTHDFPDKTKGKAVPYGVYDIHRDEACVVGRYQPRHG